MRIWGTSFLSYVIFHIVSCLDFALAFANYLQVPLQCLGAAAVLAAPNVPSWEAGYGVDGNVGGLLEAMLSPVGNFGKFLTVLLSLSVTGNIACTLYSICFNFQVMIPAMSKVPRYVFSLVGTAMCVLHFYFLPVVG